MCPNGVVHRGAGIKHPMRLDEFLQTERLDFSKRPDARIDEAPESPVNGRPLDDNLNVAVEVGVACFYRFRKGTDFTGTMSPKLNFKAWKHAKKHSPRFPVKAPSKFGALFNARPSRVV